MSYTYDAFGVEKNVDENDTNAFRYCGEYFDAETGTIYLRERYYNPTTGRFISRDSFAGRRSDPLSLNLYTYCRNNPIIYVDPSGHSFINDFGNKVKEAMQKININTTVNKITNAVGNAINVLTNTIASKSNVDNKKQPYAPGGAPGCKHGECSYLVTEDQLNKMGWNNVTSASLYDLNTTLVKNNIVSRNEIAHFLAQCAKESGKGKCLTEGSYMDKESQMSYLKDQDYYPYYGAGYIQLTGERNYSEFSKIMEDPKILEIGPEYVAKNYAWAAAGWWWNSAGMNQKISEGYTVD